MEATGRNSNGGLVDSIFKLSVTLEKHEEDVKICVADICSILARIPIESRNTYMLREVRGPFVDKCEREGLSPGQATYRWEKVLERIRKEPGSGINKISRIKQTGPVSLAKVSPSSDASKKVDVLDPRPIAHREVRPQDNALKRSAPMSPEESHLADRSIGKKQKAEIMRKKEKKEKKEKKGKKGKKEMKKKTELCPNPNTTVVPLIKRRNFRDAPSGTEAGTDVSIIRPQAGTSYALFSVVVSPHIHVVAMEDIKKGTTLGKVSGVVVSKAPEGVSTVELHNGKRLILGSSNKPGIGLASFSGPGRPANASVNSFADVVTSQAIAKGEEIVIFAPEGRRAPIDSGDDRTLFGLLANDGHLFATDEVGARKLHENMHPIMLSKRLHSFYMSPVEAAQKKAVIRIKNEGRFTATLLVNGERVHIPPAFAVVVPGDSVLKTTGPHIVTAEIITPSRLSPDEVRMEQSVRCPEPVAYLRQYIPVPESVEERPRADVPFQLGTGAPTTHAEVKQSTLPHGGEGLFANRPIKKGQHITPYSGQVYHHTEWSQLAAHLKEYGAGMPSDTNYIVDSRVHHGTGLGRFTNQAPEPGRMNAAMRWVVESQDRHEKVPRGYISLYATRDIPAGDEIFMKYGPGHVYNNR